MDQCGHVTMFALSVASPELYDTQFCVDTTVAFPALNPHVPISDLLVGGQSLFTSATLADTLSINASWTGSHWLVDGVTTGGFDWTGLVTLVDTAASRPSPNGTFWNIPARRDVRNRCVQLPRRAAIEDGHVFQGMNARTKRWGWSWGVERRLQLRRVLQRSRMLI